MAIGLKKEWLYFLIKIRSQISTLCRWFVCFSAFLIALNAKICYATINLHSRFLLINDNHSENHYEYSIQS